MNLRLLVPTLLTALAAAAPAQEEAAEPAPASPEPVMVAILWHQHQPHYLQDGAGEYAFPWVRVHATKDYYDMVAILAGHPEIHFTVNLTPVLINQMQDLLAAWEAGEPTDAFVRHTLIDADALTVEEKRFLWRNFFSLNWDRILSRFDRYVELRDIRPDLGEADSTAAALQSWTTEDFRDLQMLFNLGWMDPAFADGVELIDGTVIDIGPWIAQGRDFTEEDKRALIEMHFQIMANVLPVHRQYQDSGQIEVTTTPFYHPILPLIEDTDAAREAIDDLPLPGERFSRPGDAATHVARAAAQYEEIFGQAPRGVWPAEGSVSQGVLPLFADNGLTWFATDVQVLARSIGVDDPPAGQRFSLWQTSGTDTPVAGIFRDTGLSDRIGFVYSGWDGEEAAHDFVGILRSVRDVIAAEAERPLTEHIIPIILDGENCWEYYENDGIAFLNTLYTLLAEDPLLETVTVSEALVRSGELPVIERLHAGSWISADFTTWIGEEEENRAWELLAAARDALDHAEFEDPADYDAALDLLLIAEGSDWFWWYGDDQTVDNEEDFDEAFRGTLRQAYTLMGVEIPPEIDEPIMTGAGAAGGGTMAPGEEP